MNNIRQKNIIFGFDQENVIPYQRVEQVCVPTQSPEGCAEMFYTDINHSLRQMVDNDLFLERKVLRLMNYIDGLKPSDPNSIMNGPDGYKFALDDNGLLNIYRKVEDPISSTVWQVFGDLSCTGPMTIFGNYLLVATNLMGVDSDDAENMDIAYVNMDDVTGGGEGDLRIGMFGISCNDMLNLGNQVIVVNDESAYCISSTPGEDIDPDDLYFRGTPGGRKVRRRFTGDPIAVLQGTRLNTFNIGDGSFVKTEVLNRPILAEMVDFECLDPSFDGRIDETNDILFISRDNIYIKSGDDVVLMIIGSEIGPSLELFKIQRIEGNTFAIFTSNGIYRYKYENGMFQTYDIMTDDDPPRPSGMKYSTDVVYKMTMGSSQICSMCEYVPEDGKMQYLDTAGNVVNLTKNLRRWTQFLSVGLVGSEEGDSYDPYEGEETVSNEDIFINGIVAVNERIILMGSNAGLWATMYSYKTVNDIPRFTYDDAYEMYSDKEEWILGEIQGQISSYSDSHINKEHAPGTKEIQWINDNIMDVDFSNLCSFTHPLEKSWKSNLSAANDLIYLARTGSTGIDEDIRVKVKNFATGGEYVYIDSTYIAKLWNSKLNEFDIFIPTTETYYLAHNQGLNECDQSPMDAIVRSNLYQARIRNQNVNTKTDSQVSSHYTEIVVEILSTQYDINGILDVQAKGNSLPLNIYIDKEQTQDFSSPGEGMYHSYILPTVGNGGFPDYGTTQDEYYRFGFACFGTDSQAIHIMTTTTTTAYYDIGVNMLSVQYHGNGGVVAETGRDFYTQKFRLNPANGKLLNRKMRENRFEKEGCIFYGWSKKRCSDNDVTQMFKTYTDRKIMEVDFEGRKTLHLYAVWLAVDWNKSHTEFHILGTDLGDWQSTEDPGQNDMDGYRITFDMWNGQNVGAKLFENANGDELVVGFARKSQGGSDDIYIDRDKWYQIGSPGITKSGGDEDMGRTGYVFGGWSLHGHDKSHALGSVQNGVSFNLNTDPFVLTRENGRIASNNYVSVLKVGYGAVFSAIWTPKKYKIVVDYNYTGAPSTKDEGMNIEANYGEFIEIGVTPPASYTQPPAGSILVSWMMTGYNSQTAVYSKNGSDELMTSDGSDYIYPLYPGQPIYLKNLNACEEDDTETTIVAKWGMKTTVTFNANGGTVTGVASTTQNRAREQSYAYLPPATRTGFYLVGWYTASVGGEKVEDSTVVPDADSITLYAHWDDVHYQIGFDLNGGGSRESVPAVYGDSEWKLIAPPTRPGYTFTGWKSSGHNPATAQYSITSGVAVSMDETPFTVNATGNVSFGKLTTENGKTVELTAQWTVGTFTVTFDVNGGNALPEASRTKNVTYQATYGDLPTPTRSSSYEFDGWYTAATGGTKIVGTTKVEITGNQTLYAHWKANQFTVTFDANEGTTQQSTKVVVYNQPYGELPTAERKSYKFVGWFTDKDSGTQILPSMTFADGENKTLYAHWTKKSYTLTLNANGGTVAPKSVKVPAGAAYSEYLVTPTHKDGNKVFGGWFTKKTKGERVQGTDVCTATRTLYAHWGEKYTIKFDMDGGGTRDSITTGYGVNLWEVVRPPDVRSGFTFNGWEATGHNTSTALYSVTSGVAVSLSSSPYTISYSGTVSFCDLNKGVEGDNETTLKALWTAIPVSSRLMSSASPSKDEADEHENVVKKTYDETAAENTVEKATKKKSNRKLKRKTSTEG